MSTSARRDPPGGESAPGSSAERFLAIWCPDWPIVAAGCPHDMAVAVMRGGRVVARSAAAADDGVVIGHRRRQAQQRCPHVELLDDDPARDAREFEPVMRSVAEVAPRVDVVESGWLTVAARGPSRYFGGDHAVADHLTAVVRSALPTPVPPHPGVSSRPGVSPRSRREETPGSADGTGSADGPGSTAPVPVGIGVADGRFAASVAARLAARRGTPVVVEQGGSPEFCAPLPIGWLQTLGEIEADLVELFVRLGIRRLGDLAALQPGDVLGRFGPPGVHAHRLASGADRRPASTTDPAPERRLDRVLDDAAAQSEAVVFVAKQLADELAGSLAADGRVCTRLVVVLETEHGERSERSWFRSAGLSAAAMVERVRWQLDGWINLPRGSEQEITGGVSLIRLVPDEVRADDGVQLGLWGGQSDADRRAARAIARLTTLTSEHAVTVPVWRGGRLPSDRYRWVPATMVDLDRRDQAVSTSATGRAGTRRESAGSGGGDGGDGRGRRRSRGAHPGVDGPWPGSLPPPSPATVYDDGLAIEVLDGDGVVVQVSGRGVVSSSPATMRTMLGNEEEGWRPGDVQTIESWAGPWPVDQQWWDTSAHRRLARFQFVVAGDGTQEAILVVAEHRRWWLVARYD